MDLTEILKQLRTQLEGLDVSILALERLAAARPRRGRPPKWVAESKVAGEDGTARNSRRKHIGAKKNGRVRRDK